MSEFDPFGLRNAPRIEHAIIDEETQMMRYLADIAMADLELLPPESARRVRPDSLLAQYRADVAARHVVEGDGGTADDPAPYSLDQERSMGTGVMTTGPKVAEFLGVAITRDEIDPTARAAFEDAAGPDVQLTGIEYFAAHTRAEFTFTCFGRTQVMGTKVDAPIQELAARVGAHAADWASKKKAG